MRRNIMKRVLSFVMISVMCLSVTMPASAAGKGSASYTVNSQKEKKEKDKNNKTNNGKHNGQNNGKHNGQNNGKGNNKDQGGTLTPIEAKTTVANGDMLRGETYALEGEGNPNLVYFPVTMYNYDKSFNQAVHQADIEKQLSEGATLDTLAETWQGMYLEDHSSTDIEAGFTYVSKGEEVEAWVPVAWNEIRDDDEYIIVNRQGTGKSVATLGTEVSGAHIELKEINDSADISLGQHAIPSANVPDGVAKFKIAKTSDTNYAINLTDGRSLFVDNDGAGYTDEQHFFLFEDNCYIKGVSGGYLTNWGSHFTGNATKYSGNNIFQYCYLYKLGTTNSSGDPIQISVRKFANWNKYLGSLHNLNGNFIYSGLVEKNLDASKNIVFNKADAGLFTNNEMNGKKVYTGVQMPFVKGADGYYTFDSHKDAVYFHDDKTQQSSGTPADNARLYFNDTPQENQTAGSDGRKTGWFPFNDSETVNKGEDQKAPVKTDYYFGMQAAIPFTMTTDGKAGDEPIKFEFSGDDDVWVFIDGTLVLDLGGIHDRLDGTLNFADNTWKMNKPNDSNHIEEIADEAGTITNFEGKLFNDAEGTGVLGMTRESFAVKSEHTLTVFYMERGAGSSNCKIRFNLPVKDSVSVTKQITHSKDENGDVYPLSPEMQAKVDNVPFGFTLYSDEKAVAGATYILSDKNGQVIGIPSTDASGHFTLMNGQTAKFIGTIAEDGNSYFVEEDQKQGYLNPDFRDEFSGANEPAYEEPKLPYRSRLVTVKGGSEAEDVLKFVCENYLDYNIPNPGLFTTDDQLVLDYGLAVNVPCVWDNDTWNGDKIELLNVEGAQYGEISNINKNNGTFTYTMNQQLTNIEKLTYTVKVTGTGNTGEEGTIATMTKTGTVYIIPATNVYYEEDFGVEENKLVTYSDKEKWKKVGTATNDFQEPGLVGTRNDSPYGSDAAYLDDKEDSNGTSQYVDVTEGAQTFKYTFTGTGTTFYARTNIESGTMKVVVRDEDGRILKSLTRDTSFKAETDDTQTNEDVLYNIPVFNWSNGTIEERLTYGTYTVEVTVLCPTWTDNKGEVHNRGYGPKFWLDGIRVFNPLSEKDKNYEIGTAAYAADEEQNNTVVTLREKLLCDATTDKDGELVWSDLDKENKNFVLFTDTNGNIVNASEYVSNGPKNEVYMKDGQQISFSLNDWDNNTQKIYLGIKAPMGNAKVTFGNGKELAINNAPDAYYDVSEYLEITGEEIIEDDGTTYTVYTGTLNVKATEGLISLTNIRAAGDVEFGIVTTPPDIDAGGDGSEITEE